MNNFLITVIIIVGLALFGVSTMLTVEYLLNFVDQRFQTNYNNSKTNVIQHTLKILNSISSANNSFLFLYEEDGNNFTPTLQATGYILQSSNRFTRLDSHQVSITPDLTAVFQGSCGVSHIANPIRNEYGTSVIRCPLYIRNELVGHYGITIQFEDLSLVTEKFTTVQEFGDLLSAILE